MNFFFNEDFFANEFDDDTPRWLWYNDENIPKYN